MAFMGDIFAIAIDVSHITNKLAAKIARFNRATCQNRIIIGTSLM